MTEETFSLLDRCGLSDFATLPIAELSYGKRRLVDMALALALEPKVLLLDEPAAGLSATSRFAAVRDHPKIITLS